MGRIAGKTYTIGIEGFPPGWEGWDAHDPLCIQALPECANGRLLEQPPVAGTEPV